MPRIARGAALALLVSITLAAWANPSGAAGSVDADAEARFVALTNALRADHGLEPLTVDAELQTKARGWASTMADASRIWHSNLPDNVSANWRRLGENVGTGPAVDPIHQALVKSPSHLANLLDPGFRSVGVGVVNINGTLYVSEVFMELASQPAPSTSAPGAGTPTSAPDAPAAATPAITPAPADTTPAPANGAPAPSAPVGAILDAPAIDLALARLRRTET